MYGEIREENDMTIDSFAVGLTDNAVFDNMDFLAYVTHVTKESQLNTPFL